MATNTFKSSLTSGLTTALATIYSAPTTAGGVGTVIGIALSNKTTTAITVDVAIVRGTSPAVTYYLIKSGIVPVGGTLTIAGADQKVVMQTNDLLQATASVAGTIDVIVSVLEIT